MEENKLKTNNIQPKESNINSVSDRATNPAAPKNPLRKSPLNLRKELLKHLQKRVLFKITRPRLSRAVLFQKSIILHTAGALTSFTAGI